MATKQLTVVRPGRYGTRMLKAGDPLEANARDALLYTKLGWATEGNRQARVADAPATRNPPKPDLSELTKAELAKRAGLSAAEAKKLTKAQIIAKL
jgi:hypothetical protein